MVIYLYYYCCSLLYKLCCRIKYVHTTINPRYVLSICLELCICIMAMMVMSILISKNRNYTFIRKSVIQNIEFINVLIIWSKPAGLFCITGIIFKPYKL